MSERPVLGELLMQHDLTCAWLQTRKKQCCNCQPYFIWISRAQLEEWDQIFELLENLT